MVACLTRSSSANHAFVSLLSSANATALMPPAEWMVPPKHKQEFASAFLKVKKQSLASNGGVKTIDLLEVCLNQLMCGLSSSGDVPTEQITCHRRVSGFCPRAIELTLQDVISSVLAIAVYADLSCNCRDDQPGARTSKGCLF